MVVNASSRAYQIWVAVPGELEADWLDVTSACLLDGFWSGSDEPIGEDGIQKRSGSLVLGIPIGEEEVYHPWENPDRWAVGNKVIVKAADESGALAFLPHSSLYIASPVLPPCAAKYRLEIELCDALTLRENYPEGTGTGNGAATTRTAAVNQQLQATGLALSGSVPGTNPKKLPDRNDNAISRAGQMAAAANGYLTADSSGVVSFQAFAIYSPDPLFTHTVGVDDADDFEPLQSNERPANQVEAIAEGEEEEDPFNPSNPDGSSGGPGNEDPDENGYTVTPTYAIKETVAVGGGSELIMTVQRRERWSWNGNTFTREITEYACRGLVVPEDVYQAVRDNTPETVSFTYPSPYQVVQSLYRKETSTYEAGREGRLIKTTIQQREPRGKIFAEYYKNNPVNLANETLPDFTSLPAALTYEQTTEYTYRRQQYDSDNRGREGDDTGGQVRRITTTETRLLGEIAGGATDISDYVASLENSVVAAYEEQYWFRRTPKEWEQHRIQRQAGAGSTVATLCVLGVGTHETTVSSSGNAQPPSIDRRRPDPDKTRARKTIRQVATLRAQQEGRYRFANDYFNSKNEAKAAAETQAAIRQGRQRGFKITTSLRDEWFDYTPQARIDLAWNGKKYLGVTDLVTYTLAGNQAIVIAECFTTATVDLVSDQINPIASFLEPLPYAAFAGFVLRSLPHPTGALPDETVTVTSNNSFNLGETLAFRALNEFITTPVTGGETICAFYEFEGGDWSDSNGGNYTLLPTGTPTAVTGIVGDAVQFNSSTEKLEVTISTFNDPPDPNVPFGLDGATRITIQGYCRFANLTGGSRNFVELLAGTVAILSLGWNGSTLRAQSRGSGIVYTATSSVSISTGTWYQFEIYVEPGNILSINVDGTIDTTSYGGTPESDEFGETVRLRGLNNSGNTDLDQIKITKT